MKTLRMYVLTGAAILAAAGTALAQQGQGQMMEQGMPGMGMMGMGMGMMGTACPAGKGRMMARGGHGMMQGMQGRDVDPGKMQDLVQQRLDELKRELEIGGGQEEAWKAYADAVKTRVAAMRSMHDTMAKVMNAGSATKRLEARISMMENMLESMKVLLPATKALYESLPENKKDKADALLGGCGMM